MFTLFYTFLYINDVKKRIHVLAKPQRSSLRIHLCASERSEQAIFGVFNSFTVKKVSFFTINVKFKVILSSNSGGGGMFVQAIPPPKKVGGGDIPPSPPPPDLRQCIIHSAIPISGRDKVTMIKHWKNYHFARIPASPQLKISLSGGGGGGGGLMHSSPEPYYIIRLCS